MKKIKILDYFNQKMIFNSFFMEFRFLTNKFDLN